MPVTAQVPVITYTASGSATDFAYPFRVLVGSDLKVYLDDVHITTGYSVGGVGNESGGVATFLTPPASGTKVQLLRSIPRNRSTNYIEGGPLRANTLDSDLDRIVMMLQDTVETVSPDRGVPPPYNPVGAWVTPQVYRRGDVVVVADVAYVAALNHAASDTFSADYALGRWLVLQGVLWSDLTPTNTAAKLGANDSASGVLFTTVQGFIAYLASAGAGFIGWVQAGANAVRRSIQSRLRDVVSVKDFGATGDGVTDDLLAIQRAINAGFKSVYIPAGTYMLSGALTFPILGEFKLYGAGIYATVLKAAPGNSTLNLLTIGNPNYLSTGFSIGNELADMTIDGVNLSNTVDRSILTILGTYNNTVRNVKLGIADVPANRADLYLKYDVYTTRFENVYGNQLRVSGVGVPYCTTLSFAGGSWTSAQIYSTHAITMVDVTIQGTVAGGYNATRVLLNNVDTFNFIGGDIEGAGTAFKVTNCRKVDIHGATCAFDGVDAATVAWIDADTSSNVSSYGNYFANWSGGAYSPTTLAGAKYYVNGGGNQLMQLNDFEFVDYYSKGTFTPSMDGLTVVGAATYTATYTVDGDRVHGTAVIAPVGAGTTQSTAGASRIGNLPLTAVGSGVCAAVSDSIVSYGNGFIGAGSTLCWLPTWTATNQTVVVNFSYRIA